MNKVHKLAASPAFKLVEQVDSNGVTGGCQELRVAISIKGSNGIRGMFSVCLVCTALSAVCF